MNRLLVLGLLLVSLTVQAEGPAAKAKPQLSKLARSLLKQRMLSHALDMQELMYGALMLEPRAVAAASQEILKAPRIASEGTDPESLNRSIPPLFFKFQEQLRAKAEALNAAAQANDSAKISAGLGELMQTCVSCHAVFLPPDALERQRPH